MAKVGLLSFLMTSGLAFGRLTPFPRSIKLTVFLSALATYYYLATNTIRPYFQKEKFELCVKEPASQKIPGVLTNKEIARLERAYNIKRSELAEDKAHLKKYKYDPQSYH